MSAWRDALSGAARELAPGLVLFWPGPCFLCGADLPRDARGGACPACWDALPRRHGPGCRRCDLPRTSFGGAASCPDCAGATDPAQPPPLTATVSAYEYRDAVVTLHRRFKFGGDATLVGPFAEAMVDAWRTRGEGSPPPVAIVAPVPPDPLRWTARRRAPGRLARAVARALGVPCAVQALRKRRPTRSQTGAAGAARRVALAGLFEARSALVPGSSVLVVDDVVTTGATLHEAARALVAAGATTVLALALARRP